MTEKEFLEEEAMLQKAQKEIREKQTELLKKEISDKKT